MTIEENLQEIVSVLDTCTNDKCNTDKVTLSILMLNRMRTVLTSVINEIHAIGPIIDELEIYSVGRPLKDDVKGLSIKEIAAITEKLRNFTSPDLVEELDLD